MINPELAKVSSLRVNKVRITPITEAIQGQANSVSGYLIDLTMVGTAAKPSATMLKKMAMLPTLVTSHKTNPTMERKPHTRSNRVTFHSAFLFTKEAINVVMGKKPVLKVIKASRPTPCLICAAKAMNGAIDHSRKETRLGFTFPLTVSVRYASEPTAPMIVPTMTKF